MKQRTLILSGAAILTAILIFVWASSAALAQTGGDYDLSWSTVDDGGGYSAAESYWLGGSVGQVDSSADLVGESYSLTGGFWKIKEEYPTAIALRRFAAEAGTEASVILSLGLLGLLVVGGTMMWRYVLSKTHETTG